jgi:rhamnosyltransferase
MEKKIHELIMREGSMDNISIIIRNKNEEQHIGYAIQSCLDFFEKPEIIIVDNDSRDNSLDVVMFFNDRTDIKIINNKNYTPGKALNIGVKNASRDYVMILSAHSQILKLDFKSIKKKLDTYIAIFGKQIPVYMGKRITPRYIWTHFNDEETINMYSNLENRYFFHNAFSFFKKSTLENFPFDEVYGSKEDRYWVKDMIERKNNFLYDPSLIINHFYTKNGATWKGIG